jgi:hypothetical protein
VRFQIVSTLPAAGEYPSVSRGLGQSNSGQRDLRPAFEVDESCVSERFGWILLRRDA